MPHQVTCTIMADIDPQQRHNGDCGTGTEMIHEVHCEGVLLQKKGETSVENQNCAGFEQAEGEIGLVGLGYGRIGRAGSVHDRSAGPPDDIDDASRITPWCDNHQSLPITRNNGGGGQHKQDHGKIDADDTVLPEHIGGSCCGLLHGGE
jgi:hypothetical protein